MKIQIIQDSKGKATGVYIPMNQWKALKRQYKSLGDLEEVTSGKKQLLTEIKAALAELELIEKGQLQARSARELLDEL
jgi:hypothetical protein